MLILLTFMVQIYFLVINVIAFILKNSNVQSLQCIILLYFSKIELFMPVYLI